MTEQEIEQQKNALYETEADRLQREADNYTKKLEHERKALLILEDQYKSEKEKLDEILAKIAICIPDKKTEHQDQVKRASLHHQLQIEMVLLNNTLGINKQLQTEIAASRQEILFAESDKRKLRATIKELSTKATKANNDAVKQAR